MCRKGYQPLLVMCNHSFPLWIGDDLGYGSWLFNDGWVMFFLICYMDAIYYEECSHPYRANGVTIKTES